ncbi:MAG TPA: outer membrane protein assembly factor BamD [Burkholderiales bacterium]|nr:outer membrane protein assembly factor BamD [Burkholderiales bacterium]
MKHSLALILVLLLSGCSLFAKEDDTNQSASQLFTKAMADMDDSNYEQAIKQFETLEARYPYGRYAEQAQLEVAYAYYKQEDAASATAACDRFIKLHPTHPNVDYAYYLKGLANFNENLGLISRLGAQDMTERDPKQARESYDTFKELVARFPNSKYAEDSALRARYLINGLANHELQVALYYMKRKAYVAALNRAKSIITNYQETPSTEPALAIMVECYEALGMPQLRDDTERVLQHNFPNSKFASQSSQAGRSWWKLW